MKLIEPTTEYCRQIRAYRKEFLDCGDSMDGTHGLREIEDPVKWIEHCVLYKDPLTIPDSRVPATQYIFVREDDDRIVGMLQMPAASASCWYITLGNSRPTTSLI